MSKLNKRIHTEDYVLSEKTSLILNSKNETKDDEHMGPISITYTDVLNLVNGILPLMPIGTPIKFTGTHLTGKTKEVAKLMITKK